GAEFSAGRIRISPAFRYTRWQYDRNNLWATKPDQIEFVTGISYATSVPSWRIGSRKVRFGLIGGIPVTDGLTGPDVDELQGFVAVLSGEIELNRHVAIEANGLYRPFRADSIFHAIPFGELRHEFTVLTWQFPVLAKYQWRPQS